MSGTRRFLRSMGRVVVVPFIASAAFAQAPSSTMLALAKSDHTLAIVDPTTFPVSYTHLDVYKRQVVARQA